MPTEQVIKTGRTEPGNHHFEVFRKPHLNMTHKRQAQGEGQVLQKRVNIKVPNKLTYINFRN